MSAPPPSPSEAVPRRKTVLFCPDCGHESDVAGDWVVHETDDDEVYECPECGTAIATRSRSPLLC